MVNNLFDDAATDVKSESQHFGAAVRCIHGAREGLEEPRLLLGVEPDAGILDRERHPRPPMPERRRAGAHDDLAGAAQDLDHAITLDPDLAEAYHQRAIARFTAGDTPGAIADIQATLQHEPRSFAAFQTLAAIAEARKDWKGAYEAWQKVLEIDPKTPGGQDRLRDLRRRALGEEA